MLISDEVRKCVVFVYMKRDGDLKPVGTAFLVAQPIEGTDRLWGAVVTARHVLNGIAAHSDDDIVHLRFNTVDGIGWSEAPLRSWKVDEDAPESDVALVLLPSPPEMEKKYWPIDRMTTAEVIEAQHIGLGDEVAIAGLFSMHQQTSRNIPIVRIGNIAAMPEERVRTNLGLADAYLIEARSIGGLSGSPVFVNIGQDRSGDLANTILLGGSLLASELYLLGVLHGHWDAPAGQPDGTAPSVHGEPGGERMNVGIAVVTPATKILDIWNKPAFLAERRVAEDELRARESQS